ncbi:hypothetical protein L0Y65_01410 [Candidatus Micrarchaeota archaeon]|nr:hypothetical protein [Candidatus Micrarchaeota archaeon]
MTQVKFCPRCKKPVEAKDFMDPFYLGALDSMLPQMHCSCGYVGLPLSLPRKDYVEWAKGSARRPRE